MGARGKERRSSGSERTTRCPDCQCYVTLLSRQARSLKGGGGGGGAVLEQLPAARPPANGKQQAGSD